MKKSKLKKNLTYILAAGFIVILSSNGLGKFLARDYDMSNGWSVDDSVANNNADSLRIVGAVSAMISGFGLVFMLVKDAEE